MAEERLQKVLAAAGVASRRQCEALILAGRVVVNGQPVTRLGVRVDPARDQIVLDGRLVVLQSQHVYLALHKPRGYLTTAADELGRATVFDLLRPSSQRVFTVGRLDKGSEGLLLLTNDGGLAFRLTHPRYGIEREYRLLIEGNVDAQGLRNLRGGTVVEGRQVAPLRVTLEGSRDAEPTTRSAWVRIVLAEGRKREVRELCFAAGYGVRRLVRVRYGPLLLGRLPVGESRPLTAEELAALKRAVGLEGAPERRTMKGSGRPIRAARA